MIPDPSTAETAVGEGGSGGPPWDASHDPSQGGHHCICGQPLEASLWDMTLFASETTVAYLPCLFNESLVPGPEVATGQGRSQASFPPSAKVVGHPEPGDQDTTAR